MKRMFLVPVLVPAMLLFAGAAMAITWTPSGSADCDGWSFNADVHFGYEVDQADVEWEVVLTQGGMTVCTFSGDDMVYSTGGGSIVPFSLGDTWCEDLCGDYSVSGTFVLHAEPGGTANLDVDFTCDCDEPHDVCNFTQGYWKNHPDDWPVMSLNIGGDDYSQAELLEIFNTPPKRGDATLILAHQLIAAMLNAANGSDDADVADCIADGNELLGMYEIGSNPQGEDRDEMIDVAGCLDDWNNLECDDEDDMDMPTGKSTSTLMNKANSGAQNETWGAVKGLYGK